MSYLTHLQIYLLHLFEHFFYFHKQTNMKHISTRWIQFNDGFWHLPIRHMQQGPISTLKETDLYFAFKVRYVTSS